MATYATLTVDANDIIGADYDPSRGSVWIEANTPHSAIVVDGQTVQVGGRSEKFVNGVATFRLVTTDSADNPTSFSYRGHITYIEKGSREQGRKTLDISDFPFTASANLAAIEEAWDGLTADPIWRSDFRDEMEAAAETAAASATSAAASAAVASAVAGADTADDLIAAVDLDAGSTFRVQQDARQATAIEAGLSPAFIASKRHPLTGAFHVESFGAAGDGNGVTGVGATDNLAALNAIVAAILATPTKTGRIVFGPGNFWLSNDWMIDGEDVEVICDQQTNIYTTATTTRGAAVHFIGGGVQTPSNFVLTPQRRRFSWRGGRISSTGSGTLDNALGVVRVANCHVSDVRLDADRKALTPQVNVDNITIERVVVERGDYDAICIETGCLNVTVRDVDVIATLGTGVRIFSDSASDPDRKVRNVLIQRVTVRSAGAFGVSLSDTEKITLSQVSAPSLQLNGRVADLRIDGDCSFTTINYPGDLTALPVTTAKPLAAAVTSFANSWVAHGSPFPAPRVFKTSDGFVAVEISIKSGTMAAGTTVATIPVGYRPATRVILDGKVSNGSFAYIYLEPTGSVVIGGTALTSNALLTITGYYPAV